MPAAGLGIRRGVLRLLFVYRIVFVNLHDSMPMKRLWSYALVALVAVSSLSCSDEEVLPTQRDKIVSRSHVVARSGPGRGVGCRPGGAAGLLLGVGQYGLPVYRHYYAPGRDQKKVVEASSRLRSPSGPMSSPSRPLPTAPSRTIRTIRCFATPILEMGLSEGCLVVRAADARPARRHTKGAALCVTGLSRGRRGGRPT